MDQNQTSVPNKWEGKVCTKLEKASADQIWGFYKDFFNIQKWHPGIASSSGVSGVNGQSGCIRYLNFAPPGGGWAKERLAAVDDKERFLSYEILENTIGFESYVSTLKIVEDGDGCLIEWGFSMDPVEGWALDDFVSQVYEAGLEVMSKRMEDAALGVASCN